MKTNTLKPQIRFPEFTEDWKLVKLETITSRVGSGKTPKGGEKTYQETGIPFIRSQNVKENGLFLDNICISVEIHNTMKISKVVANDILLNITGGSIGRSCVVPYDFIEGNVNQHVCIIRLTEGNSYIIQSLLSSYTGQKMIFQGMAGGGREGLNFKEIRNFKFTIPNSLKEQKKIANFLTTVDSRISSLKEKKATLLDFKKGVMQKIFNQDIRFKDDNGNDFPDWEEKRLGEVLDYEQPTKYIVESIEYDNSFETPVLTAGKSFLLGYTDETENIFTNVPVIIFDDFTMANQFVTFPFKVKSSAMKILKNDITKANIVFIYAAMEMIYYPKGDEHKRFWISEYSKIKIPFPCLPEQTKIANYLTALDTKIDGLQQKIEASVDFKKGLLQKMFV